MQIKSTRQPPKCLKLKGWTRKDVEQLELLLFCQWKGMKKLQLHTTMCMTGKKGGKEAGKEGKRKEDKALTN